MDEILCLVQMFGSAPRVAEWYKDMLLFIIMNERIMLHNINGFALAII